jgi:FdhE protein
VAGIFLRRSREKRPALPPDVESALADLARLSDQRPHLAELAMQLNAGLRAAYAEPVEIKAPQLQPEARQAKLSAGVPLLRGETLDLDREALNRRWQRLVAAIKPYRPDATPALAAAVEEGKFDIAELAKLVVAGRVQEVHQQAETIGLDVPLVGSVLWLTLFPVFVSMRGGLEPLLQTCEWQQGYCPVCGGFPKLGEFRGLEQVRWLRCGLCAAQWQLSRLRCPYCDNRDHHLLGYLHVEAEERQFRAATCDQCGHYTKMVSVLTPLSPPQLLVTDLATVHLDLLAADKGFRPPE